MGMGLGFRVEGIAGSTRHSFRVPQPFYPALAAARADLYEPELLFNAILFIHLLVFLRSALQR